MVTREEVVEKLKNGVCSVEFTKKDGTVRKMKATLMESVLKDFNQTFDSVESNRQYNPNQIRCIDTEIDAWRSFNLDTLISIE